MIENLGKNIKTLRVKNNLSQQDLADELEISIGAISKIERGVSFPSFSNLEKLSLILRTNATELFSDDTERLKHSQGIDFVTHNVINEIKVLDNIRGIQNTTDEQEVQNVLVGLVKQIMEVAQKEQRYILYESLNHYLFSLLNQLNIEKIYEDSKNKEVVEKQRVYKNSREEQ